MLKIKLKKEDNSLLGLMVPSASERAGMQVESPDVVTGQ